MTADQLLAMPDDEIARELIRGQVREKLVTKRNRFHTRAVARLSHLLQQWLEGQPQPSGEVHAGEVGTILRRDPDTVVGIDAAYFSAELSPWCGSWTPTLRRFKFIVPTSLRGCSIATNRSPAATRSPDSKSPCRIGSPAGLLIRSRG